MTGGTETVRNERTASPSLEYLDPKQKSHALEAFQRINIDGRGKLYADELALVFEALERQQELQLFPHSASGGITDDMWLDYLRTKKRTVGAAEFKVFLQSVGDLVSTSGTRDGLEALRSARKAQKQAAKHEQLKRDSAWTNSVAERVQRTRAAPGGLSHEPTIVVSGAKPSPWKQQTENRVMLDVYEEHSAQRAKREEEDEQEAQEILDDDPKKHSSQSSRSGEESRNSENSVPLDHNTASHLDNSTDSAPLSASEALQEPELPPLRLYVTQPHPPEWAPAVQFPWVTPTNDPDCIEAVVYLQFCKELVPSLEYDLKFCTNEYVAPNGSLPSLLIKHEQVIVPRAEIMESMKKLLIKRRTQTGAMYEGAAESDPATDTLMLDEALTNRSESQNLTSQEIQHHERAVAALVEQSLRPLLLHLWWVGDKAAADSQAAYARGMPFVQRQLLPRYQRQRVLDRLQCNGEVDWRQVLQRAEQAFRALTGFLENSEFFFGSVPTAIDAKVLGHLLPLTQAPPTVSISPPITKESWPRLFQYVETCCALLHQIETTPALKQPDLQPVQQRSEPDVSPWITHMEATDKEQTDSTKYQNENSWFDASKVLTPFVVAGAAFLGFMLLRRARNRFNF